MIKEFNFDSLEKSIPERSSNSHKGDFGKVMVVGGSEGMGGAAILSSEASLFSGAGLVHLSTHPINVEASLKRNPEVMAYGIDKSISIPENIDVLLCGPGLKNDEWSKNVFYEVISTNNFGVVILDAGALHFIVKNNLETSKDKVLTPHPGEAAKLLGISNLSLIHI